MLLSIYKEDGHCVAIPCLPSNYEIVKRTESVLDSIARDLKLFEIYGEIKTKTKTKSLLRTLKIQYIQKIDSITFFITL